MTGIGRQIALNLFKLGKGVWTCHYRSKFLWVCLNCPLNCTWECTRSNLRESKIQKFPGGHAPRPPRYCVLMHMDPYTIASLTLIKPYFAPTLSQFLDEGLVRHKYYKLSKFNQRLKNEMKQLMHSLQPWLYRLVETCKYAYGKLTDEMVVLFL